MSNALFLRKKTLSLMVLLMVISLFTTAQNNITGKVTQPGGQPLPGALISIRGLSANTVTSSDGTFSISAKTNNILVISSVGYQPSEIKIGAQTTITVVLSVTETTLSDVVVTGYTTQRKKDIIGAVSVVDVKAMKSIPAGSAAQALQGQASGVTILSSGAPGGRNDIFIRGVTSFGNTQPLVLIDGVQGNLDDINMNDIESVQVLKDAGAAAIYGVRGSNGVIVITTKKGKIGKPSIAYDAYYGSQMPKKGNVFNLLNLPDYAAIIKQINPGTLLFANGIPDFLYAGPSGNGIGMAGDPAVDPSKYVFDKSNAANDYLIQAVPKNGTDWFHAIFKNAPMQSHNITASGATDKSNYLFALGYLDQQGTLIDTYLKRYTIRLNTQYKFGKHVKLGENIYAFYKQNPGFDNQAEGNAISRAFRIHPAVAVRDIMGNYGGTWTGPAAELGNVEQPVAMQENNRNNRDYAWDIIGNVFAEVDFMKYFTARTSFGGTIDNQYGYSFTPNFYYDKQGHASSEAFNENSLFNSNYIWTNTLNYARVIGKHNFKLLVGSEAIRGYGRGVGGSSRNFFSSDPDYLILNNGTTNISNYSSVYKNALYSLFSRFDYAFNEKYLVGATIRRDGSSVFGSNSRYGTFPSFSLGWRISQENFFKGIKFINDLKVRGSYGKLGSQANVSSSNAFTLFSSGFGTSYYDLGGTGTPMPGYFQSTNGNPNTSWEEDVISNIGLDITLFNNKLEVSAEWYKKSINGLLFPQPLPATAGGATSPIINIGDIRNTGLDFSATYHGKINEDIQFNIAGNVTTYKNNIVKLPAPGYFDVASTRIGNIVRNEVAHPVGSFYGYEVAGLFSSAADVTASPKQTDAAPGRFKYKDVDGDGTITAADRTFIGNPNPDFTYGINISIKYKRIDFSSIFYGSQGNEVMNFTRYYTNFFGASNSNAKSNVLKNAWTPDNLHATTPKVELTNSFSTSGTINTYYRENGSFLKLRSLVLGYTIKPEILKKIGASHLRIYLQAANLFTITKYTGIDPELSGSMGGNNASSSFGIDFGNYPNNQKNFLMGINLTF